MDSPILSRSDDNPCSIKLNCYTIQGFVDLDGNSVEVYSIDKEFHVLLETVFNMVGLKSDPEWAEQHHPGLLLRHQAQVKRFGNTHQPRWFVPFDSGSELMREQRQRISPEMFLTRR